MMLATTQEQEARPRAIVVLPVPGGPASMMMPCSGAVSKATVRRMVRLSTAWATRRVRTASGILIESHAVSKALLGKLVLKAIPVLIVRSVLPAPLRLGRPNPHKRQSGLAESQWIVLPIR